MGVVMSKKPYSLFKSKKGEREYLEAYEKTLALWPVPYEEADVKLQQRRRAGRPKNKGTPEVSDLTVPRDRPHPHSRRFDAA
jgi:hypothetical protein